MRSIGYKRAGYTGANLFALPPGVIKYVLIFLTVLTGVIISFSQLESLYLLFFLKPVSIAGYYILHAIGLPLTFSAENLPLAYCDYILPNQILRVNFGCTGLYVLFIFIAGVLAYPAHYQSKMTGLLVGIPLFTMYSILRLVIMGVVGHWMPQYLDIIHNYLMIIINAAFLIWLYSSWITHAVQKDQR